MCGAWTWHWPPAGTSSRCVLRARMHTSWVPLLWRSQWAPVCCSVACGCLAQSVGTCVLQCCLRLFGAVSGHLCVAVLLAVVPGCAGRRAPMQDGVLPARNPAMTPRLCCSGGGAARGWQLDLGGRHQPGPHRAANAPAVQLPHCRSGRGWAAGQAQGIHPRLPIAGVLQGMYRATIHACRQHSIRPPTCL
jgi:hypothetical protein